MAIVCFVAVVCWPLALSADSKAVAPTGTLRAVYLGGNAAQAVHDPRTGEIRGISADLARELGRRLNVPVQIVPLAGLTQIVEAVTTGKADIGFLANDPSRRGSIEFSQTYLRNPQSLIVPTSSAAQTLADLDKPGVRIGATRGDSIALFLSRTLTQAKLVEAPGGSIADVKELFQSKSIDAFGANRLRLNAIAREVADMRILPGSVFGVPQAIVVPASDAARLGEVNAFLDAVRKDGFLQGAIDRANIGVEIEPAPAGR